MEKNDTGRKKVIKELQVLAKEVYDLKQEKGQKRPIVIEFSGSPKAGKTSCINSLELFLKRNGFSVKIIHERASICPVSDKHSPMFNTWTASTSLAGMIGVLADKDSQTDVLILDRGIFDALCWFQWLTDGGKMEEEQRKTTEDYYLMNEFLKDIDIVFAFYVDPDTSIKREYANLLTDKPGSIMNKVVLQRYLDAMEHVRKEKGKHFHKIFKIDTSKKTQDEVGKEVTETTLNTLKTVLMERIGYVDGTSDFIDKLRRESICDLNAEESKNLKICFDLRDKVEKNNSWVQPLPIAVITNLDETKVVTVKKKDKAVSTNSPEKDKVLPWVGGHLRDEDKNKDNKDDFIKLCREGLKREINEELGISVALNNISPICIYTPNLNPKSAKHFAVCFKVPIDEKTVKFRLDEKELVSKKGKSTSGKFVDLKELPRNEMESWGLSILRHYFDTTTDTLFD